MISRLLVLSLSFAAVASSRAGEPTALEQYMLEMINRARADGNAEAARHSLSGLQEGTPSINGEPWTIQAVAQPLAWSDTLASAARTQSQALFNAAFSSGDPHSFGGTTAEQRIATAGFVTCAACPRPSTTSGFTPGIETFSFASQAGTMTATQLRTAVTNMHRLAFMDSNTPGRLNRLALMYPWFREMGPGLASGQVGGGDRAYFMITFNTANPGTQSFLTGVVYTDNVTVDQFYTPGEGFGSLTVQAWQNGVKAAETNTWASGGYRLPVSNGTFDVRLVNSQGHVSSLGTAVVNGQNVKLDSRNPAFVPPPVEVVLNISRPTPGSVTLTWNDPASQLAAADHLSGPWAVIATTSPATVNIQPGRRYFRCQR